MLPTTHYWMAKNCCSPWSGPPLFHDLQSSRAITRENHTQELGSQWDSYGTKKRVATNNTNIHLLFFNSPVQPSSKLGKRDRARTQKLGSQWDSYELKRRLPQNKTNIHLLLFNSPVQPPSKLGERERELELGNLGVSEIAMELKRRLPQNNTNIHLVSCSPVFSSLWSISKWDLVDQWL